MLVSAAMLATSLTSLTTGRAAKGKGIVLRNRVLAAGCLFLLLANVLLVAPFSAHVPGMFAACICIGVHMGMTHGLALSMLSSYMPQSQIPGALLVKPGHLDTPSCTSCFMLAQPLL